MIHRGVLASTGTTRIQPLMAKIKCRAFQTRLDEYSTFVGHGFGYNYSTSSQIRFVKSRMHCKVSISSCTSHIVGPRIGSCFCRTAMFGSRTDSISQFSSRFGFINSDMFGNTLRYMPSGGASVVGAVFRRSFCSNGKPRSLKANATEPFSKHQKKVKRLSVQTGFTPRASLNGSSVNSSEVLVEGGKSEESLLPSIKSADASTGLKKKKPQSRSKKTIEGLSLNNLGPLVEKGVKSASKNKKSQASSTHQKKAKSLSAQTGITSRASLNGSSVNSSEVLVEGGKNEESLLSADSSTGLKKKKPQSRSKKKKDELSSNSDAVSSKSSVNAPTAEKNSAGTTPVEVNGVLDSKTLPKKKTKAPSKKGKSSKEAETFVSPTTGKINQQFNKPLEPLYPPRGKSVVVVESLTKAKVIQGYLGDMYEVLPSYGHVRDLAARSGSVRPDQDFSMVWEVRSLSWTHLKSIKVAISGADNLILASDPDREGEAIAWHIFEMLQQQDALHKNLTIARVVFHEITQSAIKTALQSPRYIDENLVQAYLARRALDYLIGFNISPLLWQKLPGCQSAGRVQSAALSLICDREMEVLKFKPQEYWTIDALFKLSRESNSCHIHSHLTHFDSKKLDQLSIGSESEAKTIEHAINSSSFKIAAAKRTKVNKNPPMPYITSTLQQDAANKLNYPATYTMKLAQRLYEGVQLSNGREEGLITYTRTDGLHISDGALQDIRSIITQRYGQNFISDKPRKYLKKVKNAQEAHEAIRPTDITRLPSMLAGKVDEDCLKLYTLIWARTMACQMEPTKVGLIQVDVADSNSTILFRASCSKVEFLGFKAVYEDIETKAIRSNENESKDLDQTFSALSELKIGDSLDVGQLELKDHRTQPPPRYSEASLVKKLEELGIGRPSTYAAILKVLQDRKYVATKSRVIFPEFRGRMVSAFLSHYFAEVTEYSFTADMETELDNVCAGMTEWKGLLKDYWTRFSSYCVRTSEVGRPQVEKMLEGAFGDSLFSSLPNGSRTCPSCLEGTLVFKVSKFGAGYFIGCDQHPRCKYIARTLYGEEEDQDEDEPDSRKSIEDPKLLGLHPGSSEKVLLKNGPYGCYVQLGEDRKGYSPKRASVNQIKNVSSITLDQALDLLRYPITLGEHPEDGQPVVLKMARTGYTIKHREKNAKVPKEVNPNEMTLEIALGLLTTGEITRSGRRKKGRPALGQMN